MKHITIIKRDGRAVPYDENKIIQAIKKAYEATYSDTKLTDKDIEHIRTVSKSVRGVIIGTSKGDKELPVDFVQTTVENQLMAEELYDVARSYIIYRDARDKARKGRICDTGKAMQDIVFTDKYSRYDEVKKRRETFNEAVDRVAAMHKQMYTGEGLSEAVSKLRKKKGTDVELNELITWAFERVKERRALPAMRSMQFGGNAVIAHNLRLYNCSATFVDRPRVFQEILYALLCGCGVGYSVEFEHVERLPKLADIIDEKNVKHFIIDDSIEGWADGLGELINSYIKGYYVEFSYSDIRPRGSRLKISGGRAPGHIPLKRALERIRQVLDKACGRKLRTLECHDIICHASDAVLSGGVRRSALIAIFSADDADMMNAKTGEWFNENPQRGRANNSVRLLDGECTRNQFERIFRKTKEFGEPGIIFSSDIWTLVNPCAEIAMRPFILGKDGIKRTGFQLCNLTEINGKMVTSEEDLLVAAKAAAILGTLQAGYTHFPYLTAEDTTTEDVTRRDALIGVSITGIMDNPHILLNEGMQKRAAEEVKKWNIKTAELIGINPAARTTCIKPAGTTSIILDTASGIHPRHSRTYFRRVQFNVDSPVYQWFKKHNPQMCEASRWSTNKTDDVVTFCIEAPSTAVVKKDLTAIDQLKNVLLTQRNWIHGGINHDIGSDVIYRTINNVSNTISVSESEWETVADFLWKYKSELVGTSFMADNGDKLYIQAPFENVSSGDDEIKWNYLASQYKAVDYTQLKETEDNTKLKETIACSGGKCELNL